jgi:hypothetical protein
MRIIILTLLFAIAILSIMFGLASAKRYPGMAVTSTLMGAAMLYLLGVIVPATSN